MAFAPKARRSSGVTRRSTNVRVKLDRALSRPLTEIRFLLRFFRLFLFVRDEGRKDCWKSRGSVSTWQEDDVVNERDEVAA